MKQPVEEAVCLLEREAMIDPAARHRVLLAADLKCVRCGAEHNRQVVRSLLRWPDQTWRPLVPGEKLRLEHVVIVHVIVVAWPWPWSGRDEHLAPFCMGCAIHLTIAALGRIRTRPPTKQLPPRQPLLITGGLPYE